MPTRSKGTKHALIHIQAEFKCPECGAGIAPVQGYSKTRFVMRELPKREFTCSECGMNSIVPTLAHQLRGQTCISCEFTFPKQHFLKGGMTCLMCRSTTPEQRAAISKFWNRVTRKSSAKPDGVSFDEVNKPRGQFDENTQWLTVHHTPPEIGDGGPFKLKQKTMTGYKNVPQDHPVYKFRKVKEYSEWVELGGFKALHAAIAHISKMKRGNNKFGVFMGGKQVYSL